VEVKDRLEQRRQATFMLQACRRLKEIEASTWLR
jgi:hypothetical protein